MKVLQINSVCGRGSTGRIATDLADILAEQGHECCIAYGRDTVPEKYGDIAVVSRALNHSSDAVTMIYALADQQLQAKYSRRRWKKGRVKV